MSSVLAIADSAESEIQLGLDDFLDSWVFERCEFDGGLVLFETCVEESLGAYEGTKMFGTEGWAAMEGGHCGCRNWLWAEYLEAVCDNKLKLSMLRQVVSELLFQRELARRRYFSRPHIPT